MTTGDETPLKAPFPWFGGKSRAAPIIWERFGDVGGYVEPFAGSCAVLLNRPAVKGRRVETVNDLDGWLVNTWRAIKLSPDIVADHCQDPVSEIDYHARLAWLQARRDDDLVAWLEGDPENHDPKAAAWWLYVSACGIGDPWNPGPWKVIDGLLVNTKQPQPDGTQRELPHLGNAGQGINRELPHLGDAGQGINRADTRLHAYMAALAGRLRHTRITCGTWTRVLKPSATRATAGPSTTGIFLDPPYSTSGDIYSAVDSKPLNTEVQEWCLQADPEHRIVVTGYAGEYPLLEAAGWHVERGRASGGSGYATSLDNTRRETIWSSPSCLHPAPGLW